jgi:hypothetical protein
VAISGVIALAARHGAQRATSLPVADVHVLYAVVSLLALRAAYPREYGTIAMDVLRGTLDRFHLRPAHAVLLAMLESLSATLFWGAFVGAAGLACWALAPSAASLAGVLAALLVLALGAIIACAASLCIELTLIRRHDIWSVGLIFRIALTILGGAWFPLFAPVQGALELTALLNPLAWVAYHPTRLAIGAQPVSGLMPLLVIGALYAAASVLLACRLHTVVPRYEA